MKVYSTTPEISAAAPPPTLAFPFWRPGEAPRVGNISRPGAQYWPPGTDWPLTPVGPRCFVAANHQVQGVETITYLGRRYLVRDTPGRKLVGDIRIFEVTEDLPPGSWAKVWNGFVTEDREVVKRYTLGGSEIVERDTLPVTTPDFANLQFLVMAGFMAISGHIPRWATFTGMGARKGPSLDGSAGLYLYFHQSAALTGQPVAFEVEGGDSSGGVWAWVDGQWVLFGVVSTAAGGISPICTGYAVDRAAVSIAGLVDFTSGSPSSGTVPPVNPSPIPAPVALPPVLTPPVIVPAPLPPVVVAPPVPVPPAPLPPGGPELPPAFDPAQFTAEDALKIVVVALGTQAGVVPGLIEKFRADLVKRGIVAP